MRMITLSIEQLVRGIRELPTLPTAVTNMLTQLDDPNINVNQAAGLVGQDPALAAKLLRMANSSFFGMSGRVASIKDAVSLLGTGNVRKIVFATGLIRHMAIPVGFNGLAFWRSSVASGLYAQAIAVEVREDADAAFTTGLLHDIGKLVLVLLHPEALAEAFTLWAAPRLPVDVEREALGVDHGAIGYELARHWRFPAMTQIAIRDHHRPDDEPHYTLTDIVHVASLLAQDATAPQPETPPAALCRLRLPPTAVAKLRAQVAPQLESAASLIDA